MIKLTWLFSPKSDWPTAEVKDPVPGNPLGPIGPATPGGPGGPGGPAAKLYSL